MRASSSLIGLTVLVVSCGPFPDDVDGTLSAIRERGAVHIGMTEIAPADRPLAQAYIARVERAAGARAEIDTGAADLQLARLDQRALDLVIGDFTSDSPWTEHVTVIEPLAERQAGDRKIGLSPVAANGENRWIALLEREVRDMRQHRQ